MPTALLNPLTRRRPHGRIRGQIQMAESISAIVIVTLLIFFGIIFYTKMQRQGVTETARTRGALSAIELAQRVAQLPELACSSASVTDTSCIDLHKAIAFSANSNTTQMRLYYSYLFGNAHIEILPIYQGRDASYPFAPAAGPPATPPGPPILLYDNVPVGVHATIPVRVPFHVQNSLDHENYLGVLLITTYSPTP